MQAALDILKEVWGYPDFRYPQDEIIAAQLAGKDVLALLPTGAGKSICYQVPALIREGVCIVISPLIALMKDQVQQLKKRDVSAEAIYSGLSSYEIDRIMNNCAVGHTKLLYISPERLSSSSFEVALKSLPVSMIAIDEAHCISQWGFDFRPSYRNIAKIKEFFPDAPMVALTASATPEVQQDILDSLGMDKQAQVFKASFERENISFVVRTDESKPEKLLEIIQKVPGTAIVYATNRKKTEEVASFLAQNGISATFYHAGLDGGERNKRQENWIANKSRVMCCTNAFGMGIDKPDVRLVVHIDVPESLEAYYQEAGRGGRDGKRSFAVLLYNQKDKEKLLSAVEEKYPDFQFVKLVYSALYNHLNIALGGGKGHSFQFNLIEFSRRYKWEVVQTFNALKLLEQAGYLTLGEAFFIPSKLKFELDRTELYEFQVRNLQYDRFIKAILRKYEGVLSHLVKINELDIARTLMMRPADSIQMLKELSQKKVLTYIPSTDKPRIFFLEERLKEDYIRLDFEFIRFTKNQMIQRIEAMANYAELEQCRQVMLRTYFGESSPEPCGSCDHCLKAKQMQKFDTEKARQEILQKVESHGADGMSIHDLKESFGHTLKESYLEILRVLIDEGQLGWKDERKEYIQTKT